MGLDEADPRVGDGAVLGLHEDDDGQVVGPAVRPRLDLLEAGDERHAGRLEVDLLHVQDLEARLVELRDPGLDRPTHERQRRGGRRSAHLRDRRTRRARAGGRRAPRAARSARAARRRASWPARRRSARAARTGRRRCAGGSCCASRAPASGRGGSALVPPWGRRRRRPARRRMRPPRGATAGAARRGSLGHRTSRRDGGSPRADPPQPASARRARRSPRGVRRAGRRATAGGPDLRMGERHPALRLDLDGLLHEPTQRVGEDELAHRPRLHREEGGGADEDGERLRP